MTYIRFKIFPIVKNFKNLNRVLCKYFNMKYQQSKMIIMPDVFVNKKSLWNLIKVSWTFYPNKNWKTSTRRPFSLNVETNKKQIGTLKKGLWALIPFKQIQLDYNLYLISLTERNRSNVSYILQIIKIS